MFYHVVDIDFNIGIVFLFNYLLNIFHISCTFISVWKYAWLFAFTKTWFNLKKYFFNSFLYVLLLLRINVCHTIFEDTFIYNPCINSPFMKTTNMIFCCCNKTKFVSPGYFLITNVCIYNKPMTYLKDNQHN